MNEQTEFLCKLAGVEWVQTGFCYVAKSDELERFAELVRQDEREACAKLCEDLQLTVLGIRDWVDGTYDCAAAIRARNEK